MTTFEILAIHLFTHANDATKAFTFKHQIKRFIDLGKWHFMRYELLQLKFLQQINQNLLSF